MPSSTHRAPREVEPSRGARDHTNVPRGDHPISSVSRRGAARARRRMMARSGEAGNGAVAVADARASSTLHAARVPSETALMEPAVGLDRGCARMVGHAESHRCAWCERPLSTHSQFCACRRPCGGHHAPGRDPLLLYDFREFNVLCHDVHISCCNASISLICSITCLARS